MRDRKYADGSRGRCRSPRRLIPRSQDFSHSRHGRYSSYRGEREEYPRDTERSRRIGRRGQYDREFELDDPRFSEYDNRERTRHIADARQLRSPPRIEKRDFFDKDASTRADEWLPSYDKGSYHGHLSSTKCESDKLLDGRRKYNLANDDSHVPDHYGVGKRSPIRYGGERDDYWHSLYADSSRPGLLSSSQYLGSHKSTYEGDGRIHSQSYMMARGGVDMPRRNFSGGNGDSHVSVALRYMNNGTDRQEYYRYHDESEKIDGVYNDRDDLYFEKKSGGFHFQDAPMGIEKADRREPRNFEKEDTLLSSQGYLKVDSENMASSSQPKDYVSASSSGLREGFKSYAAMGEIYIPSHAIRPGHGLIPEPIAFDGCSEEKQHTSPRGLSGQRSYLRLPEEIQGDQLYTEIGRRKIEATIPSNVEEQFKGKHVRRIDVLNPSIDESFRSRDTRQDEQWESYPFTHLESEPHKFDDFGPMLTRKQDLDLLNAGNSGFCYGTEGVCQYGSVLLDELHADSGGGLWSNGNRSDIIQSGAHALLYDGVYDSHIKRSSFSGLSLIEELSNRRLGQKQVSDEMLYEHDAGIKILIDGNGSRKIYNKANDGDGISIVNFSENAESSQSHHRRTWMEPRDIINIGPSTSKSALNHSVKSSKSKSRDIKKRLGPVSHKHVSHCLAKKYKPSIKKRLRPSRPKKNSTLPWLKNKTSNRTENVADDMDGTPHDQDGDRTRDQVSVAKPEPPEKSKDFKQMVQNAFFKFLKEISETSMKGKKYKEQGKAGTLKCIVCGSNSEEFRDTESLAVHAFTSKKFGFRSQHLGLHRALCVVMGWMFSEQDNSEWHRKVMSNTEASTLKEDFIVWPPVVIVHNCSIDSKNPDERIIITAENLRMKLKEMGFDHILKVCNGRPANQSVMLVKFNGTLSGLHEALRYHQSFVKSKHGRAGMAELNPNTGGWMEENILYGHLGLAVDMDKLDFDTKKRCILRSKKEILSIADA